MAAGGNDVNNPTTSSDDSKIVRQGHTDGPYGNDPMMKARGDFGRPVKDLK